MQLFDAEITFPDGQGSVTRKFENVQAPKFNAQGLAFLENGLGRHVLVFWPSSHHRVVLEPKSVVLAEPKPILKLAT